MRRFFAFVVCAVMLICTLNIVAFAEADTTEEVTQETVVDEESWETTADYVVGYVKEHLEEISVIITMILTVFYQARKHSVLNKSIGTLNNNAVTVAENSNNAVQMALLGITDVSSKVTDYKAVIEALLAEFRVSAEDKKKLEQTLSEVHASLKAAKLANVELANELAELLVLANIPNSKKEELYSRHLAAVGAIADAEKTEVITDDNGQEAE